MNEETRSCLEELGYRSIKEYLLGLADEYEVSKETVFALYSVLGENELFDGLVSSLEDYVYEGGY